MTDYSHEQFSKDVVLFNKCCGSVLPDESMSEDEIGVIIQRQINIVNEELLELTTALSENDMKEVLDGVVDVMYTLVWLREIFEKVSGLENQPEMTDAQMQWLDIVITAIKCQELFDEGVVLEAMRRVAVNNNDKFTTDYSVAQEWADGVDFMVKIEEAVVDDVTYYVIKDENGKIRKHASFVGVDLGDLV